MGRLLRIFSPAVIGLLVSGFTTGPQQDPLTSFYNQRPAWSDCGGGFQCAKLKVPLDYAKPAGERIELALIRLPATGQRIGSIVLNPGGPGGSGIDYAKQAKTQVSADVRARFDVVGFDPRGVGKSTPVRCLTGPQTDAYVALDPTPDSAAETKKLQEASRAYAKGCQARSGKLLAHVGTADAARDMDVMRAALGDKKLTYLGKSYGTYLGATYADLFPSKVRALVLDGALDPTLTMAQINSHQSRGFEVAFTAFLRDCFEQKDCPFPTHEVGASFAKLDALFKRADSTPLRNSRDDRKLTEALAVTGTLMPLYQRDAWPYLRRALTAAFKGDGTILLAFADLYYGREADGSYSNENDANTAINCRDHAYPGTAAGYARMTRKSVSLAPHFGPYVSGGPTPCLYWPVKSLASVKPLRAKGAAPIVVVGTTRDPATPYKWAQAMASQLSSGVLLSFDGDGHTAYRSGSSCVDEAIDHYLIDGVPPKNGTTCPKI
ncbi:alpha/beta hydrolase [Nonomuraea sp. NPDC005983]|uniref:alpha/beta hydrolase n=1 Tax=Nonomuraea sp. NPDC005983 TaxID=3155595 RepID=UPI0033BA2858